MNCGKCNAENPADAAFCEQCGSKLELLCPKCGSQVGSAAHFCKKCGAVLSGAPTQPKAKALAPSTAVDPQNLEGERKTVTALFADIKGSTELMENLDPEEARRIVDPALSLMVDAVCHYGGYIPQSTGDGIFAVFGAPLAHEDHPRRALHAALKMQEDLRRYSTKLVSEGGVPIQCRVGVNTGEVVVRSISTGGGHTEYAPIGHTTNLASRMQTVAPIGSIAVAESTRRLCEGYFTLKPIGSTKVKGVSEPVSVYEVTGLGPLRTRLQRSSSRGLSKFVGREAEMEAMRRALELAKTGHGQIVVAVGDAGVGKSRLFFEFKARSRSGCLVLETFSLSHGKASAYLPVIELLKNYFDIQAEDDDRKRREKVGGKVLMLDRSLEDTLPHLFSLLGIAENTGGRAESEAPLIAVDRQNQRPRMLDAVKRLLLRESLAQPLIIEFEDLHSVDGETQELLNLLADSIASARILMLLNYRPEYAHKWGSKTYYIQLRLDPLGKESAEEMLTALLGAGTELASLKRLIIDRTEGNPFFMEEIKEALFDQGVLARNGGVKLAKPMGEIRLPPTVQGVLASRIDRLGREEKELLQTLAVIGREFPLVLVREVVAKDSTRSQETTGEGNLERMLDHLQLAEFIYEQPAVADVEYTFKHALTQEVAYRSVLNDRRAQLHRRIGAAIESLYGDRLEDHYGELANHYSRAGETAKAVHYLHLAGERASARSAYAEAFTQLTSGVELLKTLPEDAARDQQELRMQWDLGSASVIVNGITANETETALSRAYELSRRDSESPDRVLALAGLTWVRLFTGAVHKAREASQELLKVAESVRDPASVATANTTLGFVLVFLAELVQARERLEQSLTLFESVPELTSLQGRQRVFSLVYLGRTLWLLGFPDQALKRTREAEAAGQRTTDVLAKAMGLNVALDVHLWCGNFDVVREHLQTIQDAPWAKEVNPELLLYTDVLRGWLIARIGQPQGIGLIRDAEAKQTSIGIGLYRCQRGSLLAEACASLGRIDEAMTVLDERLPIAETEEHYYEAELHRLRGELLQMRTDTDREGAERCFRKAIDIARRQSARSWELRATTSLARLLHDTNRRDEARAMLTDIYNWFTEGFDTADLKEAKALLDELSA